MKSLSQHINEAFFETKFATGETVQFLPTTSDFINYGLDRNVWLIGKVKQITIGELQQFYDVETADGKYFKGIVETNVRQELNQILTSDVNGVNRAMHPLEDILDMNL